MLFLTFDAINITQKPRKHVINIQVTMIPLSSFARLAENSGFPQDFPAASLGNSQGCHPCPRGSFHHSSANSRLLCRSMSANCLKEGMHLPC